jgi:uracil-DNA glycosylase
MSNLGLNFSELIQNDWKNILTHANIWERHASLFNEVEKAYETTEVFPPKDQIFQAFQLCSFAATKVIIIGQDPYHGIGQAHGLSFSVPDGIAFPPSLRNISKELSSDMGQGLVSGDLSFWAEQGVLLLNSSLTVRAHEAGSHGKMGWISFSKDLLQVIQNEKEHLVICLWGNHAASFLPIFDPLKHRIIQSAHPSPLSANRGGWFGQRPFSRVNSYLAEFGLDPIEWV